MGDKNLKLENEFIKIEVAPIGAELQSLYSKKTEMEYLWQPGGDTWPHHSMLLFPNPGRIAGDRTIIGGKVYPATMHGFANDMDFEVLEADDKHILLQISATEETRKSFPYEFRFQVEFSLDGEVVVQKFRVINDDNKRIYFSLGAHPGFYCPIALDESGEDYSLEFDSPQYINQFELEEGTRLLTGKRIPWLHGETEKKLSDHYFDDGPQLLEEVHADFITMKSKRSGHFVELGIKDFPYMCLWGVGNRMSIMCIEPWCGTSDLASTDHVWENKLGIESVDVGGVFERTLTFRVG
ncbi:MAG: aldose 1-epimerase family protein [Tyzzerella sp.]|nr:aldose 1-epimerase family protein [Tyzzerella sp.]